MTVLKLDKHDEAKEIEFELNYLLSLTTRERFELMFKKTREMLSLRKETRANREHAPKSSKGTEIERKANTSSVSFL